MKAWQIFVIGFVVLLLALFFSAWERTIAAVGALLILAAVGYGFALRPVRDTYYVRVSHYEIDPDDEESLRISHDVLAVRVDLARLWLLFVPTFVAVAFLTYSAAVGRTWDFSLLEILSRIGGAAYLLLRAAGFLVLAVIAAWIAERSILRNADACSATPNMVDDSTLRYHFIDKAGDYYGGEGIPFFRVRPPELASMVFYNLSKPHLNRLTTSFVFHKFTVIAHGLTDLDDATVSTRLASDLAH